MQTLHPNFSETLHPSFSGTLGGEASVQTLHPSFSAIPEGGSLGEPGAARMIQEDERGSGGSQGFQWPQVLGPQAQRLYHHLLVGTIFDRGSQSQENCPPILPRSNGLLLKLEWLST